MLTVPAMLAVLAVLLGSLPVWVLLVGFGSRFFPGRWRLLRLMWFGFVYLLLEAVALGSLLVLWVVSGFGWRLGTPAMQHRHQRLLAWLVRRAVASGEFTFGLRRPDAVDLLAAIAPEATVVVAGSSTGAGVSLALVDRVVNAAAPRPVLLVLPEVHLLDPAVDVLLHRLGGVFVPAGRSAAECDQAVAHAAATMAVGEALVVLAGGDIGTAERPAAHLTALHTALDARPDAAVAVVGLAGLDGLSSLGAVWRSMPHDTTIVPHVVAAASGEVPSGDARGEWLGGALAAVTSTVERVEALTAVQREELQPAVAGLAHHRTRLRRRLIAPPLFGGAATALVLWWYSLRPSMLPRAWHLQAAASAICLAVGVGVGGLLHRAVRRVLTVKGRRSTGVWRERAVTVLIGAALVAVALGPWWWVRWQQHQRTLVAMPSMSAWTVLPMLLATVVLAALLLVLGRLVAHGVIALDRACMRLLPSAIARWVALAVVITLVLTGTTLGFRQFGLWADQNFGAVDARVDDSLEPPSLATVSAGPGSLVAWDELGAEGRNFVIGAPSREELSAFTGSSAVLDPVRVYVGLASAPTTAERVALAVDELRRTGAFERSVLVVATPTGTGWIDPDAARTIEYLYGGDSAIVGVQYSYLPSWIAFLLDTASPPVLGAALFEGVYQAWSTLPVDDRPKLVAFGESLGSLGGEAAFARDDLRSSIAAMTDRADAVLFTGPTRDNPIFSAIVDGRDAGSRSWRPEVAAEPNLRVANRVADIVADDAAWATPRVLYVHHPSDAIGTWSPSTLVEQPGWSTSPPAYDLSPDMAWFPFVTFVHETFDLMNGFSASPGYGHDYRTDFAHAWTMLVPPPGWTVADADRLNEFLGLSPP